MENGVLPYEEQLLSGGSYEQVKEFFQKILDHGDVQTEKTPQVEKVNPELERPIDPLQKYKEHERERQRERKIKDLEHNKQMKFQHKLEDLERWEKNRDREKAREQEKLANFPRIKE